METEYEWDDAKRRSNIEKHEIDFEDIAKFGWSTAEYDSSQRGGERRIVATGYIGERLHVVVYTMRSGIKRIISLRRANARERRRYEQSH